MVYALTAAADPAGAVVTLTATGGVPGGTYYLFRRDAAGIKLLRDAAEGVVWPPTDPLVVDDHEARHGQETDYLLTDVDGQLLADDRVTIPAWGTWLKSPGLPELNVRVYLTTLEAPVRPATRAVLPIEGSDRAVVLSSVRGTPKGSVVVSTLDAEAAAAVVAIVAPGDPVMFDTDPAFAVPYRYVSIGDVTEVRPMAVDDELGLVHAHRSWVLADLVDVDAPIGRTATLPGWTYAGIPARADAYVALPAEFATYDALAAG